MKRLPLHSLDPGVAALDGDQVIVRGGEVVAETPPAPIGVLTIVLEHGQTVGSWLDAHGIAELPEDTVIVELSS